MAPSPLPTFRDVVADNVPFNTVLPVTTKAPLANTSPVTSTPVFVVSNFELLL